jgi:two-component system OmpR family sensor kinase
MALPIRLRLALVTAILVAALLTGLGALVYLRLEADLRAAVDDGLADRATELVAEHPVHQVLEGGSQDIGDVFALIVDPSGKVIASTRDVDPDQIVDTRLIGGLTGSRSDERTIATDGEPVVVRLMATPDGTDRVVITGVAFDDQRDTLDALRDELLVALPIAAVLAFVVGWFLAGAALRPVERMRLEAEAISESEPERRLTVPPTRDELARLGGSLNRMLGRLEAGLKRERRFVDDASHELRTPLSNLQAELDLALRRDRTEDELLAALESASEETQRLSRLANDLLVVARSKGGLPVQRHEVDVAQLVHEALDACSAAATSNGVELESSVATGTYARLDPARVRQALDNLLGNAIRHTPPGGLVTVAGQMDGSELVLEVADSGPGFPAEFAGVAFEPFTRVDAGRAPDDGGTGLGLAIVRAIAEAHGGSVALSPRSGGGAIVEIRLSV